MDGHELRGEVYYRLCSAFAHGKQWALFASDIDTSGTVAAITAQDELLLSITSRAVTAAQRSLADFARHYE